MKAIDIALKDLTRSFRSAFALVFMFGIPLLMTGMFYLMFGSTASGFTLPKTRVVVANLDEGGPHFQMSAKNIPGGTEARTMGELVVRVLESDDLADLIQVSPAQTAEAARAAVDSQTAQVAVIIPADFSKKFADPDRQASLEFYQDPTLTIGPQIMRSILSRFMDGMAGVKITLNVFLDEAPPGDQALAGEVVQQYLTRSLIESRDLSEALLVTTTPAAVPQHDDSLLIQIIGSIMSGMLVMYAFFTGTSTAQSILKEEEERTLPRLFTTPTPQSTILTGKLFSVLLTVSVQVTVLLVAGRLIFGIRWGALGPVALVAVGAILSASAFGIMVNSFLKNTRQGGAIFGALITVTGMIGMMSVFTQGGGNAGWGNTVSLFVPQGWAVRGLLQTMSSAPVSQVGLTALGMLVWGAVFFTVGVWRFNKRYA